MNPSTKRKLKAVTIALEELGGDTSVDPEETLEALEEIQSDVEGRIDGIKSDLAR
jgi:hypothetical protein